jgi:hypothetical protein
MTMAERFDGISLLFFSGRSGRFLIIWPLSTTHPISATIKARVEHQADVVRWPFAQDFEVFSPA